MIDENTRLSAEKLHGRWVFRIEDLSKINETIAVLSETNDRLNEKNYLIEAENDLKEQKAQIVEQNRLYAKTEEVTRGELKRLDALLSDMCRKTQLSGAEFADGMRFACVPAAYIKRRSNLVALAEKQENIDVGELSLAIRESLDYLSLAGAECSYYGGQTLQKTPLYRSVVGNVCIVVYFGFPYNVRKLSLPRVGKPVFEPSLTIISLPLWLHCVAAVALIALAVYGLVGAVSWNKKHISPVSIKESADTLPAGICFYEQSGLVRLVNTERTAFAWEWSAKRFWTTQVFGGISHRVKSKKTVCRFKRAKSPSWDIPTAKWYRSKGTDTRSTENRLQDRRGGRDGKIPADEKVGEETRRTETNQRAPRCVW